ncbi:MAG: BMP family ABC transporter substrate-binding protein [Anaerolineaceae bacterium]|nr:BMP family ABC transporter substrate-binding protein [Anaerolineaceae bacterium]
MDSFLSVIGKRGVYILKTQIVCGRKKRDQDEKIQRRYPAGNTTLKSEKMEKKSMPVKGLSSGGLILLVLFFSAVLSACGTIETELPLSTQTPLLPPTDEPIMELEPDEPAATKVPEDRVKIIGEVTNQIYFSIAQMRGLGSYDLEIEGTLYNGFRLSDISGYVIPIPETNKVIFTSNDGDTFELPFADIRACSDCFLVLTADDHTELVMPGFDKDYWMVGVAVIEFVVDETLAAEDGKSVEEEQVIDGRDHLFCLVTDSAGILDKSFNETAWKGILDAVGAYGIEGKYIESIGEADYEENINAFLEDDCDMIIPVGQTLEGAARKAAEANPNQHFALIDTSFADYLNMAGSLFELQDATFLSGYLAAGMTETGIIGTYIGILSPITQESLDGFGMGIAHYNDVHGTKVQLLGWDMATQQALEVGNFPSTDLGRSLGEILLDEGVDIIMPILAGPIGDGTLAVMVERDTGLLIGVDHDWSLSHPEWSEHVLTSVIKNVDLFVFEMVTKELLGEFEAGDWMGTLGNGGIGIQYGVDWIDQIPDNLKVEIEDLVEKISADEIITLPVRE